MNKIISSGLFLLGFAALWTGITLVNNDFADSQLTWQKIAFAGFIVFSACLCVLETAQICLKKAILNPKWFEVLAGGTLVFGAGIFVFSLKPMATIPVNLYWYMGFLASTASFVNLVRAIVTNFFIPTLQEQE